MRTLLKRRGLRLGFAVATLLTVAAGVAYAVIPAADGAIHSCYLNATGRLRVVDVSGDCRRGETALDLGGPTRGAAFSAPVDITLGTTSATVAQIDLPAGRYLIHGKTNLINVDFGDASGAFVPCDLRVEGTTTMLDQSNIVLEGPVTTSEAYILDAAVQAPLTVPKFARVLLECAALPRGTSTNVRARFRQLDAVQVDGLNAVVGP